MRKPIVAVVAAVAIQLAWAAGDKPPPAAPGLTGKVVEVKDVDSYTYLRLQTAKGEFWAAVAKAPVKTGAQVTIRDPMLMRDFESKSLNRKFDVIVFGTLDQAAGAGATPSAATARPAVPGNVHGVDRTADAGKLSVAKAEGANGRTVAQVHAERMALKDKPVAIRAKVVKLTSGVMGRNWIHLRDGSGSAADRTDDLLVTSKQTPKVGEIVLAKGVVRTEVDLGSGYRYKVLVEEVSFGP